MWVIKGDARSLDYSSYRARTITIANFCRGVTVSG